jgi:hypothetical protein
MRIHHKSRSLFVVGLAGTVIAVVATLLLINHQAPTTTTAALSGSSFQPGRIIDDAVFYNPNAMTVQQIQDFLNKKVPVCDTWGTKIYSGTKTRAQSGTDRGIPPPYTCLKDYRQDMPEKTASSYCGYMPAAANQTAAQIIYTVSQACGVNPQVLLVLLQKEQRLITDDWPFPTQYRSATGYGCPDTAPCDAQYYGFYNQIYRAAWQYKIYRANPNNYNYRAGRNNYIQYNPNASCGGQTVYIENQATAGLYIYTPYVPNAKALSNLYGTGDSCSAYGNRNFWWMFSDWFGNTYQSIPKSNVYLPNGTYSFISALSSNKAMDAYGTDNNVRLWDRQTEDDAQKFQLARTSDGFYTIKNVGSGKNVDAEGAGTTSGTNVWTYASNDTCAQKWAILTSSNGTYELVSSCSGLALDVLGAATASGTNVQIWDRNGTNAQKWQLVALDNAPVSDDTYIIRSSLQSDRVRVLDVLGGGTINGVNIQIYGRNNTNAQGFTFVRGIDGLYTIKNLGSGKVLDVDAAKTTSGTNVQIWQDNGTCAQKWAIVTIGNQYTFLSACSGLALDVAAAGTVNSTNVQIYSSNGTNAQKWQLIKWSDRNNDYNIANGIYSLISKTSGRALDISSAGKDNGTNVQTWQSNGSAAQSFSIAKTNDNYYTITNINANKAVDVAGAGTANGTRIYIWASNGTCAQKWSVEHLADDYYIFTSACSGKALDMSGINANGANVHLWGRSDQNANQLWRLIAK